MHPLDGHAAVVVDEKLYIVDGSRNGRYLSDVQVIRGGQSVTFVGSKLIMFGGEDKRRHLMNDVHVLDLETMTWNVAETM
ncbi:putative kelch-type beta propeller [Helianthus annuus]|nr:putative kelch-type beta propeller [Helianthus annuus]